MARILKQFLATAVIVVGAIGATAPPAVAQQANCGARVDMVRFLAEGFGERLSGVGLAGDQTAFELHVAESGTWTILATSTSGLSCMVAAGHGWTAVTLPGGEAAQLGPRLPVTPMNGR